MLDSSGQNDRLRGKPDARQLEMILARLDALPTLPATASRVVELSMIIRDADAPEKTAAMGSLIDLIRCDQSLTSHLLSLAGRRGGASPRTIDEAAERLGADDMRSAVLARVFETFDKSLESDSGLDGRTMWRHCLATALAAEMLVERLRLAFSPQEGFACGLLHDMGKIALAYCLPKTYRRVIDSVRTKQANIAEFERKIIGLDHTVAGKRLAEKWRLDETIRDVIWLHHQPVEALPESLPHRRLVAAVSLADLLARRGGFGFSGNYSFPAPVERIAGQLDLPAGKLEEIIEKLPVRLSQLEESLGLDRPGDEEGYRRRLPNVNAELARLGEQLQLRAAALEPKAKAFEHLCRFVRAVPPDAGVRDVLLAVAETSADIFAAADGPAQSVVAYCFDREQGVLAVRRTSTGRTQWRLLRAGEGIGISTPGDSAGKVVARILADPNALADWLDVSRWSHEPMEWKDRWIGGVFHPAGVGGDDDCNKLLNIMAMILGVTRRHSQAVALGEELAGVSQRLSEMQESLAQAKAFEAISALAAGAGHELNNPLAVVSGRAQLMREKAATEKDRRMWDIIASQANRISDIITALMEYASPPSPTPEKIEVVEFLRKVVRSFCSSDHPQAASAQVDITVDEDVPPIRADRAQLHAAMHELVCNAAAASGEDAYIRLTGAADEFGRYVLLSVEDRGCGMDEETIAQAWTPFFSFQQAGRKAGLGLPTSKRYIENSGGRIWIRSRPKEGTTVFVQLPADEGEGATE